MEKTRNNIRELRGTSMTRAALAEKIGLSTATIQQWESGVRIAKDDQLNKLCAIFNCRKVDIYPSIAEMDIKSSAAPKRDVKKINIMLLMQEKGISYAGLAKSLEDEYGCALSRQYLHKGVCGDEKLSAEVYDMIAKVLVSDFATIKDLEKEPSYFIDSPTRIRDNEEYQDLTWEVLYEVEFGDPKHRSKMYKFTYDLIADFYRKSKFNNEAFERNVIENEIETKVLAKINVRNFNKKRR